MAADCHAQLCTIADLKRRIHETRAECVVALQLLMIQREDNANVSVALDDDAATLGALGIGSERARRIGGDARGFQGGKLERTFGSRGKGAGQTLDPFGVCVSPDGELLFVAERNNHRVQVLRASDGAHVRSVGSKGSGHDQFKYPSFVCLSRDGAVLFVADTANHRVQVLRAADGAYVRTIGSKGQRPGQFKDPRGMCLSLDGEHLFVVGFGNDRVQMLRVSDGAHVRSFGSPGRGNGQTSWELLKASAYRPTASNCS